MNQRENAYNKIRNAITYGELKPGERLIEKRLCEIFKVGRTPLREALNQLHTEGYVDYVPNKGATITKISVAQAEDIYDILALLEGYALEKATKNVSAAEMKKLRSLEKELKKASAGKDYKKWMTLNASFHEYFAKASGNSMLYPLVSSLRNRVYRYRLIAMTVRDAVPDYLRSHDEILEKVSREEAKQAAKAMRNHILHFSKRLIEFLKQFPGL